MKELVLVVESNPELLENITEILELSGYSVLSCADSVAGYEMAVSKHPAVIIYDLVVNEVMTFLRLLRQDNATSAIPITLLEGGFIPFSIRRVIEDMDVVHLHKPFNTEELVNAVVQSLKKNGSAKKGA